ncbi:MAG: hypothetical protein QXP36_07895 [Conexivisphaerales archaeon]
MANRMPVMKVIEQWASLTNTFSAAGTYSGAASLPAGQTGEPLLIRGSGNVSGMITLTFGNGAQVLVPVNPNAPYTEIPIPKSGFPFPVNSVSLTLTADGAGTIRALVGFGAP